VPWFTQKKLSYFPAKALPKASSRRLDERTMNGDCPKYSIIYRNLSFISSGKLPESIFSCRSAAAVKYPSLVLCSMNGFHQPFWTM